MADLATLELNADYQRKVSSFVDREVFYCVSTLIDDLAAMGNSKYDDEIIIRKEGKKK